MKTEKIISVKYIGQHQTLDIEVDHPSHIFYANGIATSNSHAVSYAYNCILTCYVKSHWPHEFFTSSLYYSKNKPKPHEEIRSLVSDLRSFNIEIKPPSLYHLNKNFQLIDKTIYFGLTNIKGVGESVYKKLHKVLKTQGKKLDKQFYNQFNWFELLFFVLPNITSTAVKAMIDVGCLSYIKLDRKRMKYEYEKYGLLKDKEIEWIQKNYEQYKWTTLLDCINTLEQLSDKTIYGRVNNKYKERINEIKLSLLHPPYSLTDSIVYIAENEELLLGIPLTCTSVESCNIIDQNCTCQEFNKNVKLKIYWIPCSIDRKHEITTKNKKKMCFLTVSDISGTMDSVVVFPEPYAQYRPLLFDKNNIMLVGEKGKDKGSFIVKKIYQL